MKIPKNLLYTREHEWIRVEEDKGYMGITDFAQDHLGDIVFVEIPELDSETGAGEAIAVIESVKAVSSVYSPVSGTILEVNEELEESPELLNEEPYENYIAEVSIDNAEELKQLMPADEYESFCKEQD